MPRKLVRLGRILSPRLALAAPSELANSLLLQGRHRTERRETRRRRATSMGKRSGATMPSGFHALFWRRSELRIDYPFIGFNYQRNSGEIVGSPDMRGD